MDIFQKLGNLFTGKGFNSDEEERKKRKQSAPQKKSTSKSSQQQGPRRATPQKPKTFFEEMQTPKDIKDQSKFLLTPQTQVTMAPKSATPNIFEQLVGGVQQTGGAIADVALQAGAVVANPLVKMMNPDLTQAQVDQATYDVTEAKRKRVIQDKKDITGKNIVGTKDIEGNVTKINSGQGDIRDFAALAGKSLDVATGATMFANPLAVLGKGAAKTGAKAAAKQIGAGIATTTPFDTIQAGATSYGQGNDVGTAIKDGLTGGLISAATQGVLGGAAYNAGKAFTNTRIQAQQAAETLMQAEQKAATVPSAVPLAPGMKSTNMAKAAKQVADQEVQMAAQNKAQVEQDVVIAETMVKQEAVKAVQQKAAVADATTPVAPAAPIVPPRAAAVDLPMKAPDTPETKAVIAAQERVDYLKREFAPPAEVKAAEAELVTRKAEAKDARIAAKTAAPQSIATPVTAPVKSVEAPVKTAEPAIIPVGKQGAVKTSSDPAATNKVEPIVETKPVDNPAPTEVPLTKSGKVTKKWRDEEIAKISSSDLDDAAKIKAVEDLKSRADNAQAEHARAKQVERDAADSEMTKKQKQKRADAAALDASIKAKASAKRKTVKTQAKAAGEDIKLSKGKPGGKVTAHMTRSARIMGDPNTNTALNSLPDNVKMPHKETFRKALEKSDSMDSDEIADVIAKTDTTKLDTTQSAEFLAHYSTLTHEVVRLSSKRKRTPAEAAQLKRARVAQIDAYAKIAESSSDAARSTSYLGYLYKQLDPALLSKKLTDSIKKEGDEVKITAAEENKFFKRNEKLQKATNENNALVESLEALQASKNPADMREAAKVAKQLEQSNLKLDVAYKGVNDLTFEVRQRNIDNGAIAKKKWYGRKLDTYQRSVMLSAPSGRLRDVITTNILTSGDAVVKDIVNSVFGTVVNTVARKRIVDTKILGSRASWGAGFDSFKQKTVHDVQGVTRSPRFLVGINNGGKGLKTDQRSGITSSYGAKKKNPFLTAVHTSVALPTNITQIYKKNRLYNAGVDEGLRRGFSKQDAAELGKSYMIHAPADTYKKINYDTKELSGLQAKIGETLNRKFLDGEAWINKQEWNGPTKSVVANGYTVAKNLTIPFISYMAGTTKNLVTKQSVTYQAAMTVKAITKIAKGNKDEGIKDLVSAVAQGGTNAAKYTAAAMILAPYISDNDASGKSYTPPYIRIPDGDGNADNDVFVPIGTLGPVGGQIVNMWAVKKATEEYEANKDMGAAATSYAFNLARGIANSAGLSNLAASSSPLFNGMNTLVSWKNDASKAGDTGNRVLTDVGADFATQMIPAIFRDINSFIDPSTGGTRPETRVLDDNGDRDNTKSMIARIGSGVPFWSQSLADDDEGAKASTFAERIMGGTAASAGQTEKKNADIKKAEVATKKLAGILGDDKFRDLLNDDQKKIYDSAGDKELKKEDLDKVRSQVIKAADKFMEESDYEAYGKVKQLQLDKANEDPTTSKSDIKKLEYEVKVSKTLDKHDVEYDLYKMYTKGSGADGADNSDGFQSGISQSELKKMLDPTSDYTNIELATALVDLDQKLADDGVSGNTLDATKPKYDIDLIKKQFAKSLKSNSGGGGAAKAPSTSVGTVSAPDVGMSGTALKARALNSYDSPIPNLSAQTAKTNLRKSISVQKGVKLG